MVTINTKLIYDDYKTLLFFNASQSKTFNRNSKTYRLFTSIILILGGVFFLYKNMLLNAGLFGVIGIVWFIFYPKRYKNLTKKHLQRHLDTSMERDEINEVSMQFGDDDILINEEGIESTIKYSALSQIYKLPSHFVLQVKDMSYAIIPKRDIADILAFDNTVEYISNKLEKPIIDKSTWTW